MPSYPLTNFETQKYYQNEPKFNGVCSRDNLPKIKDWSYVINFDQFKTIGTHWIALYVNSNNIKYFDSFGVEHIPKETKKFIGNKNIITNIYRIQPYDSIMCGKYKKFEKPKISYLSEKTLLLSIICSKCKNKDEKIFKEEESTDILKIIALIKIYNYFKNTSQ